ncbi:MAG: hypothetical protein ACAI44_25560 [Candidatus Sericytochromatia bacterium]
MLFRIVLLSLLTGLLLTACELGPLEPLPSPSPSQTAVPEAPPATPVPTPVPSPVLKATPAYLKGISGWAGSLKVSVSHSHKAPQYEYQESYVADGVVRMIDTSTQGSFLSWPLPSQDNNWQTHVNAGSQLKDSQNPDALIERSCSFSGGLDMDLGLSITGGSYRLAGRLNGVKASCRGGAPEQVLPTLALTSNRRYWEFNQALPAKGTNLKGSHSMELDGKQVSFSWDLNPVP